MAAVTITEALAEIKVIEARVTKKREFITTHMVRQNALKDPLEKAGGSQKAVAAEHQAVNSLLERRVQMRGAINRANMNNSITINGKTRSIADWLIWRREVAPKYQEYLTNVRRFIDQKKAEAQRGGLKVVKDESEAAEKQDVIINMNEVMLGHDTEELEATLQTLDGQLSLKNATVMVDVP